MNNTVQARADRGDPLGTTRTEMREDPRVRALVDTLANDVLELAGSLDAPRLLMLEEVISAALREEVRRACEPPKIVRHDDVRVRGHVYGTNRRETLLYVSPILLTGRTRPTEGKVAQWCATEHEYVQLNTDRQDVAPERWTPLVIHHLLGRHAETGEPQTWWARSDRLVRWEGWLQGYPVVKS